MTHTQSSRPPPPHLRPFQGSEDVCVLNFCVFLFWDYAPTVWLLLVMEGTTAEDVGTSVVKVGQSVAFSRIDKYGNRTVTPPTPPTPPRARARARSESREGCNWSNVESIVLRLLQSVPCRWLVAVAVAATALLLFLAFTAAFAELPPLRPSSPSSWSPTLLLGSAQSSWLFLSRCFPCCPADVRVHVWTACA